MNSLRQIIKESSGPGSTVTRTAVLVLLGFVLIPAGKLFAAPIDAGAQLERAREAMERERIAAEIQEGRNARDSKVEGEKADFEKDAAAITLELKKVNISESRILKTEELGALTEEYEGRTVSLKDLYDLVEKINDLFAKKGYMTCRAFLPPQKVHNGEVSILLVEGKTGDVTVNGNRHTKQSYITKTFNLTPGEIANTDAVTRRLQLFNGSHDAQLRMIMRAGQEPGTSDYEILVYEPKRNSSVTLFMDSSGYDSSGRLREGFYYANRSLTGRRDNLHTYYQHSLGSDAWGLGYTAPLNHHGMKLDLSYSGNQTKIKKGALKDFDVEGNAWAVGATLRVPFLVDANRRFETGFQFIRQHSVTEMGRHTAARTPWIDDTTSRYIPYISFAHYGKTSVVYHKHSLTYTDGKRINGEGIHTFNYQLGALWQKRYNSGQLLQARFDGQLSANRYQDLVSSDRFYIGGVNSVRGYEESLLAGEEGFAASLEYQVPLVPKGNVRALAFFDYGRIFGEAALKDADRLVSTGVGVTASIKDVSASLVLGIPLKREIGNEKVDRGRLHFTLSATF